ncbi:histidine kinase [Halobacteriales archaeon QH_3_68_24]|nr:MAG: histidine kinase [Halobacteriales archaeon QH_3_68_24]
MLVNFIPFDIYVLAFGLAALGCFGALARARRIEDRDTRRGLVGLLASSGGWAAFQLALLVVERPAVKYLAYEVSLVVGLATVGAWLYFCSAYTGRSFHRDGTVRTVGVLVYSGVVAVKVTNPLHGLYFGTELVQEPFVHLSISHGALHWVVAGVSYALVAVGFFMLLELFAAADFDTRPLVVAVALTALPVALDVVGYATPVLIDINYESLGVAAFAVAVLFIFEDRFLSVQVTGDVDDAVVFLDDQDRIRDFNQHARRAFPSLAGARGELLDRAVPEAVAALAGDEVLERTRDGETRYYLVSDSAFSLGQSDIGRVVVFADVTTTERQRRELERQNEQLEGLAAAIRHELRNTLQVVRGRISVAGTALDDGEVGRARDSFEAASRTADRMERAVADLSSLAEHGQSVDETRGVAFAPAVERAWEEVAPDQRLTVEGEGTVRADPTRLRELLVNAFQFAAHNGGSAVTVSLRPDGFAIADDGRRPPVDDPGTLFDYGGKVPHAETGVALPNARMFARAHGWTVSFDDDYDGGTRLLVSGVTVDATVPAVPTREKG